MDSAHKHGFQFGEAISFIVYCKNQNEIDYFWNKLSVSFDTEQCRLLKDRYGVSWQIVPEELNRLLETGSEKQRRAVTKACLSMKKLEIAKLRGAYEDAH